MPLVVVMYNTDELLSRMSRSAGERVISLASLQNLSIAEIRNRFRSALSFSEASYLFQEAAEQQKKNKILESRIFTRANPQLSQAIRAGIRDDAASRSYYSMFGSRASSFVKSGSVASMFSPAGYLTELYREAKGLHLASSAYNLDVRRPDLARLLLSQDNMDEEVSTLGLSNEILLSHVEKKTGISGDELLEHFSTDRFSAATPYHQPYETLRQSVLTLDPELDALASAPDVLSQADPASLLAIMANTSPELHDILAEDLNGDLDLLFAKNFPDNLTPESFTDSRFIADYYGLTQSEADAFVGSAGYISDTILYSNQPSLFKNDILSSSFVDKDGKLNSYRMRREMSSPTTTCFDFTELFCRNGGSFIARCRTKKALKKVVVRIGQTGPALATMEGEFPAGTVITSSAFNLTQANLTELKTRLRLVFTVTFANGDSDWFSTWMTRAEYPQTEFALKLNKAIRLCRATGLSPTELETMVFTTSTDGLITDRVLGLIFVTLFLRDRYSISIMDALVLGGAKIVTLSSSKGVSHFDQLFNNPALAGKWFNADGSKISLAPDAADASFARDSLLRGLAVTRGELYQLGLMSGLIKATNATLPLTLENVSTLYRLSLAARLNGLSVNELYLLFTVSPFTVATSTNFVQHLYQLSRWMINAGLSATEVWMLTSSDYPQTLTPEMLTLRSTIASAVSAQDVSAAADDVARRRLIAPYIAGNLGLSSPDLAASLVFWCENAGHFTLSDFLKLLQQKTLSAKEELSLAGNLHVLAQYSLTTQALSLSEAEVTVLAGIPGARQLLPAAAQGNALARLMSLHYFHQWLNTLGRESSVILAALHEGKLTTTLMASAMGLDEAVLIQALRCVNTGASVNTPLSNWQTIYQILQWVNVATALNTMPAVVKQLVDIRLSGPTAEQPSWDEWKALSRSLEAALTQRQAATLAASTAGRLSEVLCGWFLANVKTDGVFLRSRDELYSYFLIDNQVSSEVKTTRLAEAISGIQLYINRALNRIEPNAVTDVSTRQFFIDWEMNSRYRTWGGVSRLAYYPENYVDPLQRIGQTKMMDELLQNINQSQLSEDTVEEAFKTYLSRFETIADLKVISAYHDNVNSDSGKTWFIGRGREAVGEYYWRNVNMSRFSNGRLPANAWSEWVKIDAPINAWKDTVRPVIFRDRLHVVWVEQEEIATNGTSNPVISYRYTLKLAFLRHDGNWSSPWSFDITSSIADLSLGAGVAPGLYIAQNMDKENLLVLVYKITGKTDFDEANVRGGEISSGGGYERVNAKDYSSASSYFDTINDKKVRTYRANYQYTPSDITYVLSNSLTADSAAGKKLLSVVSVNAGKLTLSGEKVVLSDVNITVAFKSANALRERQISAMNVGGSVGDLFTCANNEYRQGWDGYNLSPVYNNKSGVVGWCHNKLPYHSGAQPYNAIALLDKIASVLNIPITSSHVISNRADISTLTGSFHIGTGRRNRFITLPYAAIGRYSSDQTYFHTQSELCSKGEEYFDFDTSINPDDVIINITRGSSKQNYTASKNASYTVQKKIKASTVFYFGKLDIPLSGMSSNKETVSVTFSAGKNGILGEIKQSFIIQRVNANIGNTLTLHETDAAVQYMQYGVYRIRLNTLLAPQLVSRANTGINAILSMETQQLPEGKLGEGTFVTLELQPYSESVHGSDRNFKIDLRYVYTSTDRYPLYTGVLSESEPTLVTIFLPCIEDASGNKNNIRFDVRFNKFLSSSILLQRSDTNNAEGWKLSTNITDTSFTNWLISLSGLQDTASPLDFNSSSALYYWELFYYVPMMCFKRMLQESKFEEARAWMNYVWNPNGYIVNGEIAPWVWNCRPLEETTSWNANPLDAIDPDAVAQNDPTHYKVATFMNFIELLVTRGDMCYRELTRDALAEAKMWYVFAQSVMGDEPQDYGSAAWSTPTLASAANTTTRIAYQRALAEIEPDIIFPDRGEGDESVIDDSVADGIVAAADTASADETYIQARTANSLVGLFLPEYNPALTELWATLRLRLYNLRHNLSIDGQPLSLALYAEPTDPAALLSSMVQASAGGSALPVGTLSLYRFPVMLERARNLVGQLAQFGSSLLSMAEHDDADAFSTLLMQQGMELMTHSIRLQQRSVDETEADIATMKVTLEGARARLDKYTKLYEEDVSTGERQAMILADTASALTLASQAIGIIGGAADLVPNTFGFACGGSRWGALSTAIASGMGMQSSAIQMAAEKVSRSEMYRRRREEWEIQRNNAQSEVNQIEAQLAGMAIRLEAANLQVDYLETQQGHTLAQLEFMQRKFTNQALYSWMHGKLSAIYYQFFDIAQSCCLMAQEALRRELNDNSLTLVRGSAWNGATAGFMAGETLQLSLAEMDKVWMERDERALEITRTVSLAQVYAELPGKDGFVFKDKVPELLGSTANTVHGNEGNALKVNADKELEASVKLADLNIKGDYKSSLGATRRIKQVSVTLPALVGPYEDVRAVLSYGGSVVMPRGCKAIAVSHGMNDSGQFQLDFNDARYLPFEGIPVDDTGSLTLSFPDARGSQKALLESLNDIILHIRYTIQS